MKSINRQDIFEKVFKEHLKIETYSKSIDSLLGPRLRNKINYAPYYQRNYVWDNNKATYFIESILLGTEIPPLIFFDNNTEIEIIDGRQRFETILRFVENRFQLTEKGLYTLKSFKKKSYDELSKENKAIIDNFLDFKLRIIEFKLVNEPPLDKLSEDRVKKEIFSRYNSGITPLKKSEIDNALYDNDDLSNAFKVFLESNTPIIELIYETFIKTQDKKTDLPNIEVIMSFIRRALILPTFPINYFAQTRTRITVANKLYEYFSDTNIENEDAIINDFVKKTNYISFVKSYAIRRGRSINRLALECFLWGLGILTLEGIEIEYDDNLADEITLFIHSLFDNYSEEEYGFTQAIITRFSTTANFLSKRFSINTTLYVRADAEKRSTIRKLSKPVDALSKQNELKSLRLNKPEPSRNSIEDLSRIMSKRRFLVRPSYQRQEVINPLKASSIIESILLGITLPAIFIFRKEDDLSEVIDGQQRILTLLGFIGGQYMNQEDKFEFSKNHKFTLRGLKILKDLNSKGFDHLDDSLKNRILDFQLYIVEIDETQNPNFDPIDLFIRLNDKPYPIRENSFEMWNSWVTYDIIEEIKTTTNKIKPWFYLKQLKDDDDRDRMENEELFTSLIFLEYSKQINDTRKTLDLYQKAQRINARIGSKSYISSLLLQVSEGADNSKEDWASALKAIKNFIYKLKIVLLDQDKPDGELYSYISSELDSIFKAGKRTKYFRRVIQDFYLTWYLLSDLHVDLVKYGRLEIKDKLKDIFKYIKNIPESDRDKQGGIKKLQELAADLRLSYYSDKKGRLTGHEIEEHFSSIKIKPYKEGPKFSADNIGLDDLFMI